MPLKPNELTAASGRSAGQGANAVCTRNGVSSKRICALGRAKNRLGGTAAWCIARSALINPAEPAAASVCPMLVLTEPMAQGPVAPAAVNASVSAEISIGSPSLVPVPCASTYPIRPASIPAD